MHIAYVLPDYNQIHAFHISQAWEREGAYGYLQPYLIYKQILKSILVVKLKHNP